MAAATIGLIRCRTHGVPPIVSILGCVVAVSKRRSRKRLLACCCCLLCCSGLAAEPAGYQDSAAFARPAGTGHPQQTPEQYQRLVAPIPLYPDSLEAQILTSSTFPGELSRPSDRCQRILI